MNPTNRIKSIDIVRGIVMIIMALDHTRDLLHETALTQSPTDLNTTTPLLFFTRWVTYLCAPTFVLLSGISANLSMQRSHDKKANRIFLLKRGIWLLVLEFTLVNFALWFDFQFRMLILQVIAAIGFGLIILSIIANVKPFITAIVSLVIIFSHNLLQYVPPPGDPALNFLLSLFFRPGLQQASPDFIFFIAYPLIPWIAIMMLGYSMGGLFRQPATKQKKNLFYGGILSLGLFIILRAINIYGDPFPWAPGKNAMFTFLSFLNVTKYPPSLLFTLLFLGIAFLLLNFSTGLKTKLSDMVSVYGRTPLFYYLLHLYFIRLAVFIMVFVQGFKWKDLLFGPFQFGRPATGSGINLAFVYTTCLVIVALLYPLCRWYERYRKLNTHKWWLRYI